MRAAFGFTLTPPGAQAPVAMKLVATLLRPLKARAMRATFVPTRPPGAGDARPHEAAAPPSDVGDAEQNGHAVTGVSCWLFPQVVLLDCDVRDKRELLDVAASTLERFHGVSAAPVARALWRRESAVTTGLGEGVAVPHARIGGISEPVTLLIRTLRPIAYGAPDRKPVTQLFVILVPEEGDPDEHLRLLANVAQLFSQPAFRERIAAATDMRSARRAFEEFADAIVDETSPPPVSDAERASARRSRRRSG
jgi:PTS system nitrogen regulatory IIA component